MMLYGSILLCSRAREITFIRHVDSQNEHPQKMEYHLKVQNNLHILLILYNIKF